MFTLQFSKQNIGKILNYGVLVILLFLFLRLAVLNIQMIGYPFPLELREGALLANTDLLLSGGNPYAFANQPEYTNIYGIFYPVVVYPIAKVFGANLTVHRAVSSFFILASCLVLFLTLRWMKFTLFLSSVAALILYWHLLLGSNFLTRPDTLGLFLFLCSIVIPWRYQYSPKSLIISMVLGILAFLTKPYFILSIPYIGLYTFIFKSKKQGIMYSVLSFISLLITVLILNHFFKCYFNNTFFVYLNIQLAGSSFDYALAQIYNYIMQNFALTIILFAIFFEFGKQILKSTPGINLIQIKEKVAKFNVSSFSQPLVESDLDLFTFCFLLSMIIFCVKLGQFVGSWMGYMYHLISPFIIILAFQLFKELTARILVAFLLIIYLNIFLVNPEFRLNKDSYRQWNNITALISQHQNIFNSPAIAPILIAQGKKIYDSGHSEYFEVGAERRIFNRLLGTDQKVKFRNNQFIQEITESVKSKKYDLIVLTKDYSPLMSENLVNKCYQYQDTLSVSMVGGNWKLDVWKPNKLACR